MTKYKPPNQENWQRTYVRDYRSIENTCGRHEQAYTVKHGEEEPQDRKDERNAIQPYKNTFTPVRSPNRHDKVQTTITDYIRDDTPEWSQKWIEWLR